MTDTNGDAAKDARKSLALTTFEAALKAEPVAPPDAAVPLFKLLAVRTALARVGPAKYLRERILVVELGIGQYGYRTAMTAAEAENLIAVLRATLDQP